MPQRRSEPEHLLAIAPLAAVARLAGPTTLVMAVSAVSNILYTHFVSRLGVEALGAGRREAAAALAGQALAVSVAIGIGFGVAAQVGMPVLFRLMGASGAVLDSATLFGRVLFGGAAITFLGGMFDSVLRGEGNVRVPAIWSTTSLVLQIACTPLFMFVFGWGLVGAALAMLACQLVATVARAFWVLGGHGLVRPVLRPARSTLAPLREIFRVGVPAALSTSVSNVGLMALTAVVTRLGKADLAAYGLGTRLDFLLMSFGFGFGAAVLTLVGLATGAGRFDRIRAFVTRAAAIAIVFLGVPGMIVWWRPALWLGLFTDDAGIHAVGTQYFGIVGPTYPFVGVTMVVAFAFQGLGRATLPLALTIARVAGVLAVAVLCTHGLGLGERAVFTTIAAGNVASALAMTAFFVLYARRLRTRRATPPLSAELAAT